MRQNIGLFFLTAGSIILGISIYRLYVRRFYQLDWTRFPWEARLFCNLLGINNKEDYFKKLFFGEKEYLLPDDEQKFGDRLRTDLPIIALFLMIIGLFLCLDYSAFCRWF